MLHNQALTFTSNIKHKRFKLGMLLEPNLPTKTHRLTDQMVASYLQDFRFGYGRFAGHPDRSSLNMPPDTGSRFPKLMSSAKGASYVLTARGENARFKRKGMQAEYRNGVQKFYRTLRRDYLTNADARLRFTINSKYPFFERLAYFWLNHFGVATKNRRSYMQTLPGFENEAIRPNVDGYFRDMLLAAALHPAMVLTLNQQASYGPNSPIGIASGKGLNENLGRELLELYTLGADGGYTQNDVVELAYLLTGIQVQKKNGVTRFRHAISEPGTRTIVGRRYGGIARSVSHIHDLLNDLADHPSTARYVSKKLAMHFIMETPSKTLLNDLENAFRESEGHLPTVYKALLHHGSTTPPLLKVRTPLEFAVAGVRAIGAPAGSFSSRLPSTVTKSQKTVSDAGMQMSNGDRSESPQTNHGKRYLVPRDLQELGHPLWGSPGPDGFPDRNADWLDANGLAKRLRWASRTANLTDRDPIDFATEILGEMANKKTLSVISRAASRQEGIALALMSPEFNRR